MIPTDEQYVIQLWGGVDGMENHPELMSHIGRYVTSYEPEKAPLGEQWIQTTNDIEKALGFPDFKEVHAFYSTTIGTRLKDNKPDRPITVYHTRVAKRKEFK